MTKTRTKADRHSGSTLDSLLEADGMLDEVEAVAIKRVIAWQLAQGMKRRRISKSAMATRLRTSRSQLDRLLDPENAAIQLDTMARAVGKHLRIELVDVP